MTQPQQTSAYRDIADALATFASNAGDTPFIPAWEAVLDRLHARHAQQAGGVATASALDLARAAICLGFYALARDRDLGEDQAEIVASYAVDETLGRLRRMLVMGREELIELLALHEDDVEAA